MDEKSGSMYAVRESRKERESTTLKRVITTRQFVLMALGSSIGAGFLVSTGQALAVGGPVPLLLAFMIVGLAVWITMCNLGELATTIPVQGSFYEYSVRFISPAWGFAMGWNYVMSFVFVVPFEIIVMVMSARFWNPDIRVEILVPIFILGLAVIYICGARWYAEAENLFGTLKMIVLTIFVFTALCILARAVPSVDDSQLAYHTWRTDAFKNGPVGFLFVFMSVGVAYGGTEMLGLTAGECRSPRRVMQLAGTLVSIRIIFLYVLPMLMLGLLLKIDLRHSDPTISPFVQAIAQAKIRILPDIINAIIVMSIFSMANAAIFAASRALQAISARGMGPRFCAVVYRGRPVGALIVVFAFSLLAFAKAGSNGDQIFTWLLALASCSNYLTWSSICLCQIRCRRALERRGGQVAGAYKSPLGTAGSVYAITIFIFGVIAQIVAAAKSPLPAPPPVAASFLGLAVVFGFWIGYMIWKRDCTLLIPLDDIQLEHKEEGRLPVAEVGV
ncbi:amino acid permease/ SLC12A domain-containing protein [Poronia punctata]|nr:amino acid permease/ SLC12A domain-containing protein [Poronia punctata]